MTVDDVVVVEDVVDVNFVVVDVNVKLFGLQTTRATSKVDVDVIIVVDVVDVDVDVKLSGLQTGLRWRR